MAGSHVHEDDLTLLYYDELASADARAARTHLEGCAECRMRQAELARLLAMVGDTETPEPDAGFEAAMWRRLQPALRAARPPARAGIVARCAPGRAGAGPAPGRWALAGGVAALVLAAFVAGRFWPAPPPRARWAAAGRCGTSRALRERVLLSALGDHFDRTEAMLVELAGTSPGDRVSIAAEQQRAADLLAATRLYRRAATDAGDSNVAEVLELLQRILVEVTGSPSELSSFDCTPCSAHRDPGAPLQTAHRLVGGADREQHRHAGRAVRPSPAPDQTGMDTMKLQTFILGLGVTSPSAPRAAPVGSPGAGPWLVEDGEQSRENELYESARQAIDEEQWRRASTGSSASSR